ncbi:MAG: GDP-mannose 4,6-dehydratase [Planctomycetes bacterium]|nr:GDP-mannose 4,6-dehydratase [Planctomycetota bacterium]
MPIHDEHKALITGGCGFAGAHLFEELLSQGWEVALFDLQGPPAFAQNRGTFFKGDVRSRDELLELLNQVRPGTIFHLAGIAFVPAAEKDKSTALAVNLLGGETLFQAALETVPNARVVVASSSEVYGKVRSEEIPLKEGTPLRPANYYAFTKAALENAASYAKTRGLDITVLRPFNHIGPGQSDQFVTSAFARQIAQAEAGIIPPVIRVGNLEAVRDFTDVEDMMRAYRLAGSMPMKHRTYNLCSGRGVKIREILDRLVGLSSLKIEIEQDPARLRPSDMPVLIGDHTRFTKETGWEPRVSIQESLQRILGDWRARFNVSTSDR